MLTEIICDKFVDEGAPRGTIRFRRGLNIVLGSERGDNSLGKSTLLLVIDFAFGGTTYSRSDDILRNVGSHEVLFAHEVGGDVHHFARSFESPSDVWLCGECYERQSRVTIEQFNERLLGLYHLNGLGRSFRDLVGPFLRAYGKGNDDEAKPLAAVSSESPKNAVGRLMALFEKTPDLAPTERRYSEVREAKTLFVKACKSNLIPNAGSKSQYRKNEARAAELRVRLEDLESRGGVGILDISPDVAERVADIRMKSSSLARKRGRLRTRLRVMDGDLSLLGRRGASDYDELLRFFPNASLKAIEEVERFHRVIADVLKSEHKELSRDLEEQIKLIDLAIGKLNEEAESLGSPQGTPATAFREYARVSSELERVTSENATYDRKASLQREVREAKERLEELSQRARRDVERTLNSELARMSGLVNGEGLEVPRIDLKTSSSYSFGVPNDTGAGSRVASMVLLDLALLNLTALPAVSEDTFNLKQVEDKTMARYLSLCEQSGKQVFVALDKVESYGDGAMSQLVERNTVIRLSHGHELFGRAWNVSDG